MIEIKFQSEMDNDEENLDETDDEDEDDASERQLNRYISDDGKRRSKKLYFYFSLILIFCYADLDH